MGPPIFKCLCIAFSRRDSLMHLTCADTNRSPTYILLTPSAAGWCLIAWEMHYFLCETLQQSVGVKHPGMGSASHSHLRAAECTHCPTSCSTTWRRGWRKVFWEMETQSGASNHPSLQAAFCLKAIINQTGSLLLPMQCIATGRTHISLIYYYFKTITAGNFVFVRHVLDLLHCSFGLGRH